ncbi:beta-galactosidase [Cohnella zeiphila]|uniref:Beta-galactosidase n=1 Tax=Cohnella zeiphila TaxID=2761120 RepID=A0A7X0VYN2_9BACL|nr:beta-galactosidase [Cohnella zeiphila]MBB6734662.1 beta-galactosidase [Cohnella zeiphila]
MKIDFERSDARDAVFLYRSADRCEVALGAEGGGISLHEVKHSGKRFIVGDVEVLEEHSAAMMFRCFLPGAVKERIFMRFGLLPKFKTRICLDLHWLDNSTIFTNRTPGTLKLVIHGQRTDIREVDRFELGIERAFHDVKLRFENFYLTDEKPEDFPLPQRKMVDEFGQWKEKEWPGKIHSMKELSAALQAHEGAAEYPFPEWNRWGGDAGRKLKEGTGFFSTFKSEDGRWHLTDPDGCDYFSLGPCGTRPGDRCRVDSFEPVCDWLPDEEDPEFKELYSSGTIRRAAYMPLDRFKAISFTALNLKRVYGDKWREKWEEISYRVLMKSGINSQGNFPGLGVNDGRSKLPYVRELPGFPTTNALIFRDFPDVLSPEYREKSEVYARTLEEWKNDAWLIGYFLRNEPEFNFVEGLAIADEVLRHPAQTYCRLGLIQFLKIAYGTIEALNRAWGSRFAGFADLERPIENCSSAYPGSQPDIRKYSAHLIREYVKIPSLACRSVDPNHLNLGLRWSKAYNLDMMAGWEYFDVFSINCYDFDPTRDMDFVKNAGVDLPILLGEYHCGALDRGLSATGLKGVVNQEERGVMWRHFVEKVAAHPYGVGAHWFQYNDQFCLGRYDGENYQIGMVDICMQPYPELMAAAYETSKILYKVKNGEAEPYARQSQSIPMIGY